MIRSRLISRLLCMVVVFGVILLNSSTAKSPVKSETAVDAYREYLDAARAGSVDRMIARIEQVPATSLPLVERSVKSCIALEAVKTEMTTQFGGPASGEEEWDWGLPNVSILDVLGLAQVDRNAVKLVSKYPELVLQKRCEVVLFLRDGRWRVAATQVIGTDTCLGLSPPPKAYTEPSQEEREAGMRSADNVRAAAEKTLQRLRNHEYKTALEVRDDLLREIFSESNKRSHIESGRN